MIRDDDELEGWTRPALLIGAGGAVLAALLGMLAPQGGAAWYAPRVLEERVATALSAAGHPGLDIAMDGQRAVLRGIVEDQDDIASAERAALTAAGPGGAWAGGVTSVDTSGVSVGSFARPFAFSARREGPRLVLSGVAPSNASKAQILRAAQGAFPTAERVDQLRIAGGAPSARFTQVAVDAVRALAHLGAGEVRVIDSQVVVIGDGSQQAVDAVRRALADEPAPFNTRFALTIDGLDVEHPELQGLNLVTGSAETCERAFDRLMERNVINFASNSATIDPSSRTVLDGLASVALRCDRYAIEVAGHTDNQGEREPNMQLSQRRADAVANYLATQGVDRARLLARGYGPDRPRADNATTAGQAQNRRIEFYVSGA
jgi:outer membrane protein OmpA-like peptidoglycan-associated protein